MIPTEYPAHLEARAQTIIDVKRLAREVVEAVQSLRGKILDFESALNMAGSHGAEFPDGTAQKLQHRATAIRYTCNGIEAGFFQVEVERAADAAWRCLP